MKKLFLLLAALSFVLFTAEKCSTERKTNDPADEVDTLAPTPSATELIVMVYSNAYDGFLNVREQPDVKSPIIGKILNGPMGAVKMGEVGGWTIVKVGDKIGYASSRYLQTTPTKEFTDKDMEKCIQGIWTNNTPMEQKQIMLFPNGLYALGFTSEGWVECGTWSVTGNALLMHCKKCRPTTPDVLEWVTSEFDMTWKIENGDKIADDEDVPEPFTKVRKLSQKEFQKLEDKGEYIPWFQVDEEHWNQLYEAVHLKVKGTYPSGE